MERERSYVPQMDMRRPTKISGTLVNAYFVCRRKAWLLSREFSPDPEFDLLVLGKLLSEEAFKREKREVTLEGMKIDLVRIANEEVVVGEVKRSPVAIKSAVMQVCYYLFRLKQMGFSVKGELLFPRQKKRLTVELRPDLERELARSMHALEDMILEERPPVAQKTRFCDRCSFYEFCFC